MEIRDKKVNKIHIGEKFKIHDCERDSRTLVVRSEEEDEESITDGDTAAYINVQDIQRDLRIRP